MFEANDGESGQNPRPVCLRHRSLLEASVREGTTETAPLAEALCLSRNTIRAYWNRICHELGAHTRFAAVLKTHKMGVIAIPPPDSGEPGEDRA